MRPSRVLASATAGATALVLLSAAPSMAGNDRPSSRCDLLDAEISTTAQEHEDLTAQFGAYGDSGQGWTGGDSTFSIPLQDGRNVWVFSDTFLGPVNSDGTRPLETPFLNNSFVVQDTDGLNTVTGGTPAEPASLIEPPEDGGWYWVGDGVQASDGTVQLTALQFWYGGGGAFDFGWESNHLARFDADTLELLALTDLPSESGVQWASWIEPAGKYTYIYGVEDGGAEKFMHVARVRGTDLTARWQFWTGNRWSWDETRTTRLMDGVANEYSVSALADGYLLITQDTHEIFSRNIEAYVACSPTGPFHPVGTVYEMPEVGAGGSYGNPNIFAYNAHEHPELREVTESGMTTVLTYNVNSFDSADLYDDVTIYRPRFVELEIDIG
ncbi:DUF4185 domain-containing protein [Ruania halotolerans]|uniref:DUF4185 domain-containing protein n=1 Tax=Ruania halotolerans TaxID=2897773 RepID=UPI001E4A8475|nr:DUF4185 domain-containing protein [Ruania halotolerans]UFU07608.1 DUF4185 domain-containing protein [Ruania halotolerans]